MLPQVVSFFGGCLVVSEHCQYEGNTSTLPVALTVWWNAIVPHGLRQHSLEAICELAPWSFGITH